MSDGDTTRVRARVLKVEGELVTLGVYFENAWRRVHARSRIPVREKEWIEGDLYYDQLSGELQFVIRRKANQVADFRRTEGLDYEV